MVGVALRKIQCRSYEFFSTTLWRRNAFCSSERRCSSSFVRARAQCASPNASATDNSRAITATAASNVTSKSGQRSVPPKEWFGLGLDGPVCSKGRSSPSNCFLSSIMQEAEVICNNILWCRVLLF